MDIEYLKDTLLNMKYVNPPQVDRFLFIIQRDEAFFSSQENFEFYVKYMFGSLAGEFICKLVKYHEDVTSKGELPQSESQS